MLTFIFLASGAGFSNECLSFMLASLTTIWLYFWLSEERSTFSELLAFSELTAEILRGSRWALLNFIASACVGEHVVLQSKSKYFIKHNNFTKTLFCYSDIGPQLLTCISWFLYSTPAPATAVAGKPLSDHKFWTDWAIESHWRYHWIRKTTPHILR